ncbi:MAG: endopeptidase La [Thermoanaerobaculales bacterium]|nr:endopeptidase La [Thermoanaerobaculales bacterium]
MGAFQVIDVPESIDFDSSEPIRIPDILPAVALRDMVLLPFTIVPLAVGRASSLEAINKALAGNRQVLLLAQRDGSLENPGQDDLYDVGCVGQIMRMVKLPDGDLRVLVQGLARAHVDYITHTEPHLEVRISALAEPSLDPVPDHLEVLSRSIREGMEKAVTLGRQISPEVMLVAASLNDPLRLADLVTANLGLKLEDAQSVLEALEGEPRLELVHRLVERENALLEMQHEISSKVRGDMDRNQKEFFLRQQLRTIQKELGEIDDLDQEIDNLRKRADEAGLDEVAREEVDKQLRRLTTMHPDSAESSVIRTWLDWMVGLPWSKISSDDLDLEKARQVLDQDHFGLEKIKERIIEILAVKRLKPDGHSPILCFVGPPGVGKTSLGRSIARALGRQFARNSLGGIRDEAEIRGHRRTYVGALPGRIIQALSQAGTSNPVFMLDEVDKLGADGRGDPSSALLEVLDPEQNHAFRDHYLGIDVDLSRVLFIATANVEDTIQPAFLDRMEVIRLSGYTEEEKLAIAQRHLVPQSLDDSGLSPDQLTFTDASLRLLVAGYTREAGVRNLQRQIGAVCRKMAVKVASGESRRRRISPALVERLLGPRIFLAESRLSEPRVGVSTGLAYTAAGGDVLLVEALALSGKGQLKLTGSLGEVMQESAAAALSRARAHAEALNIDPAWFMTHDIHLHVPEGGVPKDGPSAGITLLTAILSVASGRAVRHDLAMTGEITLRGEVLPIGGVKEKVLAALRSGITEILLPRHNERDLADLPLSARRKAHIHFVATADDVLEAALLP